MIKWTTQQKLAITSAGKDVLVTASAGTGKTAVLAQRCAQLLADTTDRTGGKVGAGGLGKSSFGNFEHRTFNFQCGIALRCYWAGPSARWRSVGMTEEEV